MRFTVKRIIYPEGDIQEIPHKLNYYDIVDLNGYPIRGSLNSPRTIVYRVNRITSESNRNEDITNYFLEQVNVDELSDFYS